MRLTCTNYDDHNFSDVDGGGFVVIKFHKNKTEIN